MVQVLSSITVDGGFQTVGTTTFPVLRLILTGANFSEIPVGWSLLIREKQDIGSAWSPISRVFMHQRENPPKLPAATYHIMTVQSGIKRVIDIRTDRQIGYRLDVVAGQPIDFATP